MNHVINLAVQSFLKSIKGIQGDENDEEIEDTDLLNEEELLPEGFAIVMWKIRSITKVSSKVTFTDKQKIASSSLRTERFKECCKFVKLAVLKLIYDIVTCWDLAYKMLSRALYLCKAIDHYIAEDEDLQMFALSKKEWD